MHRAETTVTDLTDLAVVKDHIKSALKNCGYQDWVFSNSNRKAEATPEVLTRELSRKRINSTLPYIQGISDKICRAYKKAGYRLLSNLTRLYANYLLRPDKPPQDQLAGTIYCLECEDCHKRYIGESARPLDKRIKELLPPDLPPPQPSLSI